MVGHLVLTQVMVVQIHLGWPNFNYVENTMSFNGADARKLTNLKAPKKDVVAEQVGIALETIRQKAEDGHSSAALHNWWADKGYSRTDDYNRAVAVLQGLGFDVKFFYEERQFVDMYTIVSW